MERLLEQLADGCRHSISANDFNAFLAFRPPVGYHFQWDGEVWDFGYAEVGGNIYAFKGDKGEFWAQKTDLLNPYTCGIAIEDQLRDGGAAVERLLRLRRQEQFER